MNNKNTRASQLKTKTTKIVSRLVADLRKQQAFFILQPISLQ